MSKRGFSLIEVLVVTAVIMLLVALLMPVMQFVRRAAQKAVCISNLGQIGLSLEMYSQDFHAYFPNPEDCRPYPPGYSWSHWGKKILPYIDRIGRTSGYRTHDLMRCPGDRDKIGGSREVTWRQNSYAYNTYLGLPEWQTGNGVTPRFLPHSVRRKTIIIADGWYRFGANPRDKIYYRHDTQRTDNYHSNGRKPGDGTTNALFGDIHVESLKDVPPEMRKWY